MKMKNPLAENQRWFVDAFRLVWVSKGKNTRIKELEVVMTRISLGIELANVLRWNFKGYDAPNQISCAFFSVFGNSLTFPFLLEIIVHPHGLIPYSFIFHDTHSNIFVPVLDCTGSLFDVCLIVLDLILVVIDCLPPVIQRLTFAWAVRVTLLQTTTLWSFSSIYPWVYFPNILYVSYWTISSSGFAPVILAFPQWMIRV